MKKISPFFLFPPPPFLFPPLTAASAGGEIPATKTFDAFFQFPLESRKDPRFLKFTPPQLFSLSFYTPEKAAPVYLFPNK